MLLWLGFALAAMATAPVQAQTATETVLHHFASPPQGAYPEAGVVRDPAGNLDGTTVNGGAAGWGVVFKLDTAGRQTVLYNFTGGADGGNPSGGVIGDSAGNFYGTTLNGGAASWSVVFKLDKSGQETVLYSFTGGTDGWNPSGGVIRYSAGNLYGTPQIGGAVGWAWCSKWISPARRRCRLALRTSPMGSALPEGCSATRQGTSTGLLALADLHQAITGFGHAGGVDGLRRAPEIQVRNLVHAGNRTARRAGFFGQELAPDVGYGVFGERLGRISALLRTVVHQAVFADVQIAGASPAAPAVLPAVRNIVLEIVELRIAAFPHGAHGPVHFALRGGERLQLPGAIVNDAHGRSETQLHGALADHQRILGIANTAAHHGIDIHVKIGVFG